MIILAAAGWTVAIITTIVFVCALVVTLLKAVEREDAEGSATTALWAFWFLVLMTLGYCMSDQITTADPQTPPQETRDE